MKNEELKRIDKNTNGELLQDVPKIIITAKGVKNAQNVLKKTKEIMKSISKYAYTDSWPTDEAWKTILPKWFVESMTSKSLEEIMETPGQWHYESWIDNVRMRCWLWYSSKVENDGITIVLEPVSIPYLHDTLLYILYSQGVKMEDITVDDYIYNAK